MEVLTHKFWLTFEQKPTNSKSYKPFLQFDLIRDSQNLLLIIGQWLFAISNGSGLMLRFETSFGSWPLEERLD